MTDTPTSARLNQTMLRIRDPEQFPPFIQGPDGYWIEVLSPHGLREIIAEHSP